MLLVMFFSHVWKGRPIISNQILWHILTCIMWAVKNHFKRKWVWSASDCLLMRNEANVVWSFLLQNNNFYKKNLTTLRKIHNYTYKLNSQGSLFSNSNLDLWNLNFYNKISYDLSLSFIYIYLNSEEELKWIRLIWYVTNQDCCCCVRLLSGGRPQRLFLRPPPELQLQHQILYVHILNLYIIIFHFIYISYGFINVEAFKSYLRIGRSCTNEFDLLVITSTLESKLVVLDIVNRDIFLAIPRSAAMLIVLLEDVSNDILVRESSKIIFKDTSTHVSSLSLLLFVFTATFSSMLNNGVLMLSIMTCLWNSSSNARCRPV